MKHRQPEYIYAQLGVGNHQRLWNALTWLLYSIGAAALVFVVTASYSRKAVVQGVLIPPSGAIAISPGRAGIVKRVLVHDGDSVHSGQPLFEISTENFLRDGSAGSSLTRQANLNEQSAIKQQMSGVVGGMQADIKSMEQSQKVLADEYRKYGQELAIAHDRTAMAKDIVDRSEDAHSKGFISELQYKAWRDSYLQAQINESSIEMQMEEAKKSLDEVQMNIAKIRAQSLSNVGVLTAQEAQLDYKVAVDQIGNESTVVATRSGNITAVTAKLGINVTSSDTLAVLLPEGENLDAEFFVPPATIGFIRKGDIVRLQYDAFPYERYGMGTADIVDVSRAPVRGDASLGFNANESGYLVHARLRAQSIHAYGESWQLPAGTTLKGVVVLEKRTFLEWVLSPINSLISNLYSD